MKEPVRIRVARVTASVSRALFQENRFDPRFEKVKIKDVLRRNRSRFLRLARICRARLTDRRLPVMAANAGEYTHPWTQAYHSCNHKHRESGSSKIQHFFRFLVSWSLTLT